MGVVGGRTYQTYLYDPAEDSLTRFPLDYIQFGWDSVGPSVKVVGVKYGPRPDPGPRTNGTFPEWRSERLVWDAGVTEPVAFDETWPSGGTGAISQDSSVLMLRVDESTEYSGRAEDHGIQVIKRVGSEWRPAASGIGLQWSNQIVPRSPHGRHTEVAADLSREVVADLNVPGDGRSLVERPVVPPRMPAPFPEELATVGSQMREQLVPFHTAIFASVY